MLGDTALLKRPLVEVGARHRGLPRLVALLPAHNEALNLPAAVRSLQDQSRPPDEIIVVADNCTDDTEGVARALGVQVFCTRDNVHKKAGALNQALFELDRRLDDNALVLVMDADCILDPTFLESAREVMAAPAGSWRSRGGPVIGGVGGTFLGGPGGGLVGMFQRNEYARYARDVRRLQGRALVLTGTASVFPLRILRQVAEARRTGALPDKSGAGDVYDVHVLTEDNELSLALMHLGYGIVAPRGCTLVTEVMETWGDLARQRARWKRGAVENIVDYGFTRVTWSYWLRQVMCALGLIATVLYIASIVWGFVFGLQIHPVWLGVSLVFSLERVVTVRRRGFGQMLLAAPLVIEMAYDLFLQAVQAQAFLQVILRKERKW